jgi:hypothetical protein
MKTREQYSRVVRRCTFAAGLGLLALLLWFGRSMIADRFAESYEARIGLMIQERSDQARVQEALVASRAQWPNDASARLVVDPTMWGHPDVMVSAPSSGRAVAAAQTISKAIATAFDASGGKTLSIDSARVAHAVPNGTSDKVSTALTFGAPLLGLLAVGLFVVAWRQGRASGAIGAPDGTGYFVALSVGVPIAISVMPGWLFMALFAMAIPGSIAVAIVVKMQQVRRASRWPSAPGRIVRSQTRRAKTAKSDSAPSVGNLPDVAYVYTVDGVEHRGTRISIGEFKPDSPEVEAALQRYQVGRTGPVFYNPDKPAEAVLERNPPASPLVMYGFAGGVVLIGLLIVFGFTRAHDIIQWLQPHFPPGAIVHGFLFFAAAGLISALVVLSDLAETQAARRWPAVPGTVLSSRAEGHSTLVSGGGSQTATVWSPLVEYSFRVGERTYHGSRIAFGPEVAGGRAMADAVVARYPEGSPVTVHYDPSNPAHATLETNLAFRWVALVVPLACFALALFFSGRLHF